MPFAENYRAFIVSPGLPTMTMGLSMDMVTWGKIPYQHKEGLFPATWMRKHGVDVDQRVRSEHVQ